ncbi:MAG: hypothetical protein QXJ75_05315 [Candidatus Bathyarchaeia archaeon]
MAYSKALVLPLVLMMALSVTGVAAAHWSDTVKINGTVYMGDLIVGWDEIIDCWDNENENSPPKDVGDVSCSLSDEERSTHTGKYVYHKLSVNLTNVYPQYEAWCKATLTSAGTIPAHIISATITPGAGLVIGETFYDVNGRVIGWELDNAETGGPVLNVYVTKQETGLSLVCNQIDPCDDEAVDVYIDVKQDGTQECHTYTFDIEFEAIQWNKVGEVA